MNLFNIIQGARIGMTARYQAGDMVLEAVLDCLQSTWVDRDDASLSEYHGTRPSSLPGGRGTQSYIYAATAAAGGRFTAMSG